ncbi:MAG: alpha/beta hydrolase [Anaerolineae bacterium]|jgi:pimeloyl-ACP methyl ester carboxylesterase|nr:alpha/beta hydrolase [Anaerolineae bacterium]
MEYTVRDIPIYYEVHGSGRPILMIHGWSPDHRLMKGCMEPVFQSVDTAWQRIYLDLPGMGKTPGRSWITGTDQMLQVILEFIDGVIPEQHFSVAGESYGGYLARGVIKERTAQVDGLLLICPIAIQEIHRENATAFQVLEKDPAFVASLSEEERRYFEGINVIQTQRVWERFRDEILPGLQVADYAFLEQVLSQQVPYVENVDRIAQPYRQPTLMVMGRQDSAVGYRDHWQLIENFSRASFVVLDKAGHNLQIEQDVLFTALVKEWLARILSETP